MGRRSNDQPFRITEIRQLPCENVDLIFTTVVKRVLNARAALAAVVAQSGSDDSEPAGDGECPA